MIQLKNTLYITSSDRYLSLDGENVVIREAEVEVGRVPLHNIDGIVTFGYTGASPGLMGKCAKENIPLVFLSKTGRFLARVNGEYKGNVLLRKKQYRVSENEEESLNVAKYFILGKIFNARWVIERALRDHSLRMDTEKFKAVSVFMYNSIKNVDRCLTLDQLRGVEGEAASLYFSVFDDLILQQKENFKFSGRSRRPPLDYVNALLSFAYTLLNSMVTASLETVGLDPYVGFLHRDRPGRVSLSLDVMEELRPVLADRFVLTLINKKIVQASDFQIKENGAVYLTEDARKTVITAWQTKKQDKITHPFLEEKVEWGLIPHIQAQLLARHLRGDIDGYPPFMWK